MSRKSIYENDVPTEQDLQPKALSKAFMKRTVNNPLVIVPAAVGVFLGFLGLITGWRMLFGAAVGCELWSVGAWFYYMKYHYKAFAEERTKKLREQMKLERERQLNLLEGEFKSVGFRDGKQAVVELREAYNNLVSYLAEKLKQEAGNLDIESWREQAEQTYLTGATALRKALSCWNCLQKIDKDKLVTELAAMRGKLKKLQALKNPPKRELDAVNFYIDDHEKRIALYDEQTSKLSQLLATAETCEGAMERILVKIDRMSLTSGDIDADLRKDIAKEFEGSVDARLKVDELMQRDGGDPEQEKRDETYARLAREATKNRETQ